jgi:chemotaxis protein histidine kinase CheA
LIDRSVIYCAMDYQILTEIDITIDEIKDWETELESKWTSEQRMKYLNLKLKNFQTFFKTQSGYWERELNGVSQAEEDEQESQRIEAEERAKAQDASEKERIAAERKAAIQRAVAEKLHAEKMATEKAASEKADADLKAQRDRKEQDQRAAAERVAAERAVAEKLAQEKKATQERAIQERIAADKATQERRLADQHKQSSDRAQPLSTSTGMDLNEHMESEKKDCIFRIGRPTSKQAADLTDPTVLDAYLRVRNDLDSLMWFILGYQTNSQNRLIVASSGTGGFSEMHSFIQEDAQFVYINYKFGDTQRSKFIFMTYVPDSLPGLKKSRVVGHRPAVEKMLKYIHLQWHILDKNEMKQEILEQKLLAAGGANYSVQESDKGDFSGYKQTTKEFYTEKDKNTKLTDLLYDKGPLARETPMDIGGRSMVAAQSEFKSNLRDLK